MLKRHTKNTMGVGLDMIIFFLNKGGGGVGGAPRARTQDVET